MSMGGRIKPKNINVSRYGVESSDQQYTLGNRTSKHKAEKSIMLPSLK